MHLCLQDLAEFTGGELSLARMPPRDGELSMVRRLVLRAEDAGEGDVYWCLRRGECSAELAYFRGALGVVAEQGVEPWPGRFSLVVDDPVAALARLVEAVIRRESVEQWQAYRAVWEGEEETSSNQPELKVLQLCAGFRVDIYSPTCGRGANEPNERRCRRRAA
jgi:hypothetical protein